MTTTEEIPTFGRSHDPDDLASRNLEIGGLLRRVKGTYASVVVVLAASNVDSSLVISAIAYDATEQTVSWRQTGGIRAAQWLDADGVTLRDGYLITATITLTDGRHYDQSVIQLIDQH